MNESYVYDVPLQFVSSHYTKVYNPNEIETSDYWFLLYQS